MTAEQRFIALDLLSRIPTASLDEPSGEGPALLPCRGSPEDQRSRFFATPLYVLKARAASLSLVRNSTSLLLKHHRSKTRISYERLSPAL
jgi:hypothetical protein